METVRCDSCNASMNEVQVEEATTCNCRRCSNMPFTICKKCHNQVEIEPWAKLIKE